MPVTDADERLHPVEDPSEHWSDSLYFNAWDPASGTFLLTRIAVLANAGRRTGGVLVWLDGVPGYGYGREVEGEPPGEWDVMAVEGLEYRMERSLQRWTMRLDDGDDRGHLTWDGFTGCVLYADNGTPTPRPWAWGHYEQTCRVTGDLVLGGRRIRFDGLGQRDHSWGHREWSGLREWHWVTGFFGTERSFNLTHVFQSDGTVTVHGFVYDGGHDRQVVGVRRTTDETDQRSPRSYRLDLVLADGGTVTVEGEAAYTEVPVRPHEGTTIVHEVPMRLRSDGLDGFGIYELLENDTGS